MIGELYDANNVVVGQAACLVAPKNTAPPTAAQLTFADPFALTPWTTADPLWTPAGGTDSGWTFGSNKTTQQITMEEQSAPAKTTMPSQVWNIQGAMVEDVAATLDKVLNMLKVTTAPATGTPGYDTHTPTDDIIEYAVALIMANKDDHPRYLYFPIAVCLDNVSVAFRRAQEKRMYAANFQSNCSIDLIQMVDVTTAALP